MFKKCVYGLLLAMCALLVLFPYWFACLHILKLRSDLNNPIVNSFYRGWSKVSLDENIEIKLPDTWTIETGQRLTIYDGDGIPVAYGIKFENQFDKQTAACRQEQYIQLLSDCAGQTVTSYTPELFGSNRFGNTAKVCWQICTLASGQEAKITSVGFTYHNQCIYYISFIGEGESYCDEAEAIAYSYKDD